MKNTKKGFSLIELLVVIAIIGVLTSIILPKFGTARQKGSVAAYRSEMDNFRKKAELFYGDAYTYIGLFTTTATPPEVDATADASIQILISDLMARSADGKLYGTISDNDYALYGRIPGTASTTSSSTDIWCIDSKGKSDFPTADAVDQFTTAPATQCW